MPKPRPKNDVNLRMLQDLKFTNPKPNPAIIPYNPLCPISNNNGDIDLSSLTLI